MRADPPAPKFFFRIMRKLQLKIVTVQLDLRFLAPWADWEIGGRGEYRGVSKPLPLEHGSSGLSLNHI